MTGYHSQESTEGYDGDTSSDSRPAPNRQKQLMPDKYDGKSVEWNEYIVAQVNGWNRREKAMYMAGSLTGKPEEYYDAGEVPGLGSAGREAQ